MELGGFPLDTLAEDQDLTIAHAARRLSRAVRQFRPSRGPRRRRRSAAWPSSASAGPTARCNACGNTATLTFNPRYGALGMIALPQVWLFQIVLTALAPLVDLLLHLAD